MKVTRFSLFVLALFGLNGLAPNTGGERQNMRGARYCEIFVIRRHLGGPDAEVYNTLGLNDCPQAAWRRIDKTTLKASLKATAIVLNGPRYFMMDAASYEIPGKRVTFQGLPMQLVAHIALPFGSLGPWHVRKPYTETTIRRSTHWIYFAERPVFELVSAQGTAYAMQSYSLIVDPSLTQQSLSSLGARLKLPSGWKYRVITPSARLVLETPNGTAHVIQDNLENTYQRL